VALAQALAPANTRRESHETADRERVVLRRSDRAPLATRLAGFAFVTALHGLGLLLLWHYTPARDALVSAAPIFIDLLSPQKPIEEPKLPEPPKPVVKARPAPAARPKPNPPDPIIAAPAPAPSEFIAPAPPPPPPVDVAAPKVEAAPPAPDTPPRFDADYSRNPPPTYPAISRRNGEHGRVLLRVLVDANGDPREVEIKTTSGSERLDRSAQETVRHWKFVPARVGSDAVDAWVLVPIVFALER